MAHPAFKPCTNHSYCMATHRKPDLVPLQGHQIGESANVTPSASVELDSGANGGIMSRVMSLRGLRRSNTMNSAATDRSGSAATDTPSDAEHFENPAHPKTTGGVRTYVRSTSRQSVVRTASSTTSPTAEPHSTVGSMGGTLPPDLDALNAVHSSAADAQPPLPPRSGTWTPENVPTAPPAPPAAPITAAQHAAPLQFAPGQQAAVGHAGNEQSVDLLSGPIHGGTMSAIPEVTEPLTGQITGTLDIGEAGGMGFRASPRQVMPRASSAGDMSPMGPPADNSVAALVPPSPMPPGACPPTMPQRGSGRPVEELRGSSGAADDRADRARPLV